MAQRDPSRSGCPPRWRSLMAQRRACGSSRRPPCHLLGSRIARRSWTQPMLVLQLTGVRIMHIPAARAGAAPPRGVRWAAHATIPGLGGVWGIAVGAAAARGGAAASFSGGHGPMHICVHGAIRAIAVNAMLAFRSSPTSSPPPPPPLTCSFTGAASRSGRAWP
jgi:hypothetical protein